MDIESRVTQYRALLEWLDKQTDIKAIKFTNYMCLIEILSKDGWKKSGDGWEKQGVCLTTLAAARQSVAEQLGRMVDQQLQKTVATYKGRQTG